MSKRMFSRSLRSGTYKLGRFLGDVQAVSSGSPKKISKRAARRLVGRAIGKSLWKLDR